MRWQSCKREALPHKNPEMIKPKITDSFSCYLNTFNFLHKLVAMCLMGYLMNTHCIPITRATDTSEIPTLQEGSAHTVCNFCTHQEQVLVTANPRWKRTALPKSWHFPQGLTDSSALGGEGEGENQFHTDSIYSTNFKHYLNQSKLWVIHVYQRGKGSETGVSNVSHSLGWDVSFLNR